MAGGVVSSESASQLTAQLIYIYTTSMQRHVPSLTWWPLTHGL